jgi:hypothetical protein
MVYGVRDSRAPEVAESLHPQVKDAIAAAMASGLDVYVHADDCPPERPLGADCPCRPAHIAASTRPRRRFP